MISSRLSRLMQATLFSAALVAAAQAPALAQDAPPRPPHHEARISVSGEGHGAIRPDMAIVSLSVVKDAGTAREALDANNTAMSTVLAALREAGIEDRDLQTSGFSVSPQYRYPDNSDGANRPPELIGYQTMNTLTVRVRDLKRLGDIIDRSVTLGINQGGGIQFTNDDPEAIITKARGDAVADAMRKARTLADAAGVRLGRVIELSENTYRPEPLPIMRAMAAKDSAAESVPVATGENTYSVNVTAIFAIAP